MENKEDIKNQNTVEDTNNVEETGTVETQTTTKENEGSANVKTEAQKMADAIVAKKLKGMPTKEELKAFHEWQDSQKTEAEKQVEKETELQTLKAEKQNVERENIVLKKGVNLDEAEFVVYKVSKMDGDFEDNLETFLKENPKYTKTVEEETKSQTTGFQTKKGDFSGDSGIVKILKQKHPDLY